MRTFKEHLLKVKLGTSVEKNRYYTGTSPLGHFHSDYTKFGPGEMFT